MTKVTRRWALLLVFILSASSSSFARQGPELLRNTNFTWDGERLTNWEIGNGTGGGSVESIVRTKDGALELSGNSRTGRWKYVAQELDAKPGDFIRLTYEARAVGVKKQPGQFDNCYVGLRFANRAGGNMGIAFYSVTDEQFANQIRIAKIPAGAVKSSAMIFLSKTGSLHVRNLSAKKVHAASSFDLLVEQMNRYYSYFHHKKIDWETLARKYRPRATAAAKNRDKFEKIILEMLAELKDGHVWLMKNGKRVPAWSHADVKRNIEFNVVRTKLRDIQSFGRMGFIARTKDHNIGYVCVTSLSTSMDKLRPMLKAIGGPYETEGMIVDLRANSGGNELLGRTLAGIFCQKPVTYAINRFRKNDKHNEFVDYPRGPLTPIRGRIYDRPVVALIGAGAVSSAEGTALMFQALPNATLIGQPTRGSSGNPAGVTLPNGTEVWFSRWIACNAKGEPIEDRGVQPDIMVEHSADDPALARGIKELTK